ncbi:protein transport protein SEC23 G-like [Bidens hawaiensis]|uniref:protein transport protein SEC23 G-like n=1 Tax=Bidens hawaiensis TaxID=980011 RepID=UPI00404B8FBE
MDFVELEAIEGLRWSWNSWPVSKPESNNLVIPLSIMQTPLMKFTDLPLLSYDPLICSRCGSVLNPYARVDYPSRIWVCPFCYQKNSFPRSYAEIGENNIPAELFPTYSTVEYQLGHQGLMKLNSLAPTRMNSVSGYNWESGTGNGVKLNSLSFSSGSLSSLDQRGGGGRGVGVGIGIVFVVDACSSEEELQAVKNELLLVVGQLPENVMVGLVVFDLMVRVYDLAFTDCLRVVVFHGERELSSSQIIDLLGTKQQLGKPQGSQKHSLMLPISECEFNIATAIEDIHHSPPLKPGHRASRCTGNAVLVSLALLEACSVHTGSRVMLFTSGPATIGPGSIASQDLNNSIRTHRDINAGHAPFYYKSCEFYKQISEKLTDLSSVLDLFACSLDQVGVAEMRAPVEKSGGFVMLAESFESDQFRKSLRHIFKRDEHGFLNMCFDASIEIVTTKDVKIHGAIGPCVSLRKKNASVSENEVGEGGTHTWKLGTITDKTSIAFFFEVSEEQKPQPGTAFFIQFVTKYRHGNMGFRKRVTSAARRWVSGGAPEIAAGFDQETAGAVMARLAVHETSKNFPREVVRWLDKELISFASKFGDYIPEDPSSFRLSTAFSLYPQFMYHLRRSQFIDVFNTSPDETAFFQIMLNREGVVGSLIMIQPTLLQYSFSGPPVPVLLDVCSLSPDVILLFDSYFYVVIHYGSKIAQWKKMGYDRDPNHEGFRKLLEAPEVEVEELVSQRVPVPKVVRCDQHSSQARFLLAKLNPSVTHKSSYVDGSEVIMTDDVSLQVFIEHLQELAVQG